MDGGLLSSKLPSRGARGENEQNMLACGESKDDKGEKNKRKK